MRRKVNQDIFDKRRQKKKNKFTGNARFVIHSSSREEFENASDDEADKAVEDIQNDDDRSQDDEPLSVVSLGYLDEDTGEFIAVDEPDEEVNEDIIGGEEDIDSSPEESTLDEPSSEVPAEEAS